jgi:hypothetical protein
MLVVRMRVSHYLPDVGYILRFIPPCLATDLLRVYVATVLHWTAHRYLPSSH